MDTEYSAEVPAATGSPDTGAMPEGQQQQEAAPASKTGTARNGGQVPTGHVPPGPVRPGSPPPATMTGQSPPGTMLPAPPVADMAQMLSSLVNMFSLQQQAMNTTQQQMHAFTAQQARFQHEMYEMQTRAIRQKQKANTPKFHGRADEDLELWLFHIEAYIAAYTVGQSSNDSRFVDMVVPLGGKKSCRGIASSSTRWEMFPGRSFLQLSKPVVRGSCRPEYPRASAIIDNPPWWR
ncbi:hypothetical protein PI124_g7251 [Phytophthora idaei]|nr:hypothetical protein PI125_g12700 [Phytophthora idaei]KAG3156461.1 hypothetical protein PI126_g8750 [Phytophthora idaei]KAG3248057.1 hypothetical protein PI124_g7251 [Phytophthora idaei]